MRPWWPVRWTPAAASSAPSATARRALTELGHPPGPILNGAKRQPLWPDGVVGSLTHCRATARRWSRRPAGSAASGWTPSRTRRSRTACWRASRGPRSGPGWSGRGPSAPGIHWDRLLFSAKESTYKAWYPLAHRWLGFEDASITPHPDGAFDVALMAPGPEVDGAPLTGFTGRWLVASGLVVTVICLPVPAEGATDHDE